VSLGRELISLQHYDIAEGESTLFLDSDFATTFVAARYCREIDHLFWSFFIAFFTFFALFSTFFSHFATSSLSCHSSTFTSALQSSPALFSFKIASPSSSSPPSLPSLPLSPSPLFAHSLPPFFSSNWLLHRATQLIIDKHFGA